MQTKESGVIFFSQWLLIGVNGITTLRHVHKIEFSEKIKWFNIKFS